MRPAPRPHTNFAATRPTITSIAACLILLPACLFGQKPVISPGGVVNAANFTTTLLYGSSYPDVQGMPPETIASIFGANLASSTVVATNTPLPTQLSGTSVLVNGIAAPLFYVSPSQINFQVPGLTFVSSIAVSTAAGLSEPYTLYGAQVNIGLFSQNSSGCGPGVIQNVASNGGVSLNTSSNSASPGNYVTVYGTGMGGVSNPPPVGSPAPASPLSYAEYSFGPALNFTGVSTFGDPVYFAGVTPGLIGVDQVNFQVPKGTSEGCAIPVTLGGTSQPVTMSIHTGGGQCVDPPTAGFGDISWQKTISTAADSSTAETDSVTVSLQAWPGQQAPPLPSYIVGYAGETILYTAPACPIPGHVSLDAGTVSVQGSGLSRTTAPSSSFTSGQISGLTAYQATLPSGSIQAGSYTVTASGGSSVAAFQTSVNVGSDIQITTPLAGKRFGMETPAITINWTGGDPNAWVTVTLLGHIQSWEQVFSTQAHANAGTISVGGPYMLAYSNDPNGQIIIDVTPDPTIIPSFSASGLTLGGRQSWKYSHIFQNVLWQDQ